MAIIVVGGHSRNVGKTLVVAGIIEAFNNYAWTAIKISPHRHAGNAAAVESEQNPLFHIYEECDRHGSSDTSRFLAAGASRALWIQTQKDGFVAAMDALHPILRSSGFVIIEGNAVLRCLNPDIYVFVLRNEVEEFKDGACEMLRRADAAVIFRRHRHWPGWEILVNEALARIPCFISKDPQIIPKSFIKWIKTRLPSQGS